MRFVLEDHINEILSVATMGKLCRGDHEDEKEKQTQTGGAPEEITVAEHSMRWREADSLDRADWCKRLTRCKFSVHAVVEWSPLVRWTWVELAGCEVGRAHPRTQRESTKLAADGRGRIWRRVRTNQGRSLKERFRCDGELCIGASDVFKSTHLLCKKTRDDEGNHTEPLS